MKGNRLFRVLYYILEKGQVTARELAEKFEVSVRTIYRDVDVISSAGIPIFVTSGRNGGIQISPDYVLEKSFFTKDEKEDILSTLQSVSIISNFCQKETISKLAALFNVQANSWYEIDLSRWGDKQQDKQVFETLKSAVISRKVARIDYINSQGIKSSREIYPLKILYKSNAWYLKAYSVEKPSFRIFKFHRILNIELLDSTFSPMEFPEEASSFGNNFKPISLEFPEEMAYRVYDEFDLDSIVKQDNHTLKVSVTFPIDNWLVGYLLSFGTRVKVIEPAYLRNILAEEAKKIYESNKS